MPRVERFFARTKVGPVPTHRPELGPCLLWTGGRFDARGGYGQFYDDDGRGRRAHRVAWEIKTGTTLPPSEHVLHRCDTPTCVRFEHLQVGDQTANMADMDAKGRRVHNTARGEAQYRAVLTEEMVAQARRRFAAGEELRDIIRGTPYPSALKHAIYGKSWTHVEMPSYAGRARQIGSSAPRCPQGHEFSPENTGHTTNRRTGHRGRYCKQCNRDRARANAQLRRAKRRLS